mgnify:CR=1 FL=1
MKRINYNLAGENKWKIYTGGFVIFLMSEIYKNSKKKIANYKNGELNKFELVLIKNEWDAALHGGLDSIYSVLLKSIIWPISYSIDALVYGINTMQHGTIYLKNCVKKFFKLGS